MNSAKRITVIFLVSLACVSCDQGSKFLASSYLPRDAMISYLNDIIRIGYIENTGAFLGLGGFLPENLRFLLFSVSVGLFLAGLLFYLGYNSKLGLSSVTGLSLILGGGASNLYDRIVNEGAVIDFLNLGIGAIRTGIFNVADMVILSGAMLVLFVHLKYRNGE